MHPEENVHYIRIVKNEKSVLYLTYKIICGRQRLYALRLEKNRAKNNCAACQNCSGRRQNLSSGAFRSKFPFGSGLGQTEKPQNSPSEKVLKTQKNPAEIRRFQPDWSECRDSNPRPLGPEPSAIPNFATPRQLEYYRGFAAVCQGLCMKFSWAHIVP